MATIARLTTQTLVESLLPPNYNSPSTIIDATEWGVILDEASEEVQASLRAKYVRFNAVTDTPPTPKVVQKIATRLAAVGAYRVIRFGTFNGDLEETAAAYEDWCEKKLDRLQRGIESIPHEIVTSETLTFGTGGTFDLGTDQAFLAVTGQTDAESDAGEEAPTVIVESVRVTVAGLTGYRVGVDFTVEFSPRFQKWFLWDRAGDLRSEVTPTVSYRWSYERWNQPPRTGRSRSGRLQFV